MAAKALEDLLLAVEQGPPTTHLEQLRLRTRVWNTLKRLDEIAPLSGEQTWTRLEEPEYNEDVRLVPRIKTSTLEYQNLEEYLETNGVEGPVALLEISSEAGGYGLLNSCTVDIEGHASILSCDEPLAILVCSREALVTEVVLENTEHSDSADNEINSFLKDFEDSFDDDARFTTPAYAINIAGSEPVDREKYGLPADSIFKDVLNNCVLRKTVHKTSGIHLPKLSISSGFGTLLSARKEELGLARLDYLIAGAPKMWYVVEQDDQTKFENAVIELKEIEAADSFCDQFVRHAGVYLEDAALKVDKIRYKLFVQNPGDMVIIWPGCYHYGINTGVNISETINFASNDWMPPTVRECVEGRCSVSPVINKAQSAFRVEPEDDAQNQDGQAATGNRVPENEGSDRMQLDGVITARVSLKANPETVSSDAPNLNAGQASNVASSNTFDSGAMELFRKWQDIEKENEQLERERDEYLREVSLAKQGDSMQDLYLKHLETQAAKPTVDPLAELIKRSKPEDGMGEILALLEEQYGPLSP